MNLLSAGGLKTKKQALSINGLTRQAHRVETKITKSLGQR